MVTVNRVRYQIRRMKRRALKGTLYVLFVVAVMALLAEVGLRGFGEIRVFAFFKGRYDDVRHVDPSRSLVLAVGDSYTWGGGSDVDHHTIEGYPEILEARLNAGHDEKAWEVINFGIPGYTSTEAARLLERLFADFPGFRPDLCIVATGFNNYTRWQFRKRLRAVYPETRVFTRIRYAHTHLKLYRFLYYNLLVFHLSPTHDLYTMQEDAVFFKDPLYLQVYETWVRADLERILALCEERGTTMVVLAYHRGFDSYPVQKEFCRERDVLFVDIPARARDPETGVLTFQKRSWHPTHAEYEKIAGWVYDELETAGLTERSSP